jgi:hypothetical protein
MITLFLIRHRVAILVAGSWLAAAMIAWPRVGRCIWMGAIALVLLGLWSFGRWLMDADTWR